MHCERAMYLIVSYPAEPTLRGRTHHIQVDRVYAQSFERKINSGQNRRSEKEEVASKRHTKVYQISQSEARV